MPISKCRYFHCCSVPCLAVALVGDCTFRRTSRSQPHLSRCLPLQTACFGSPDSRFNFKSRCAQFCQECTPPPAELKLSSPRISSLLTRSIANSYVSVQQLIRLLFLFTCCFLLLGQSHLAQNGNQNQNSCIHMKIIIMFKVI